LQATGKQNAEVVQQLGMSEQIYDCWKMKYGGVKQGEAKRLEALEQENRRLQRLPADVELDKSILKEALEGNDRVRRGRRSGASDSHTTVGAAASGIGVSTDCGGTAGQ
jgi:putative transposase